MDNRIADHPVLGRDARDGEVTITVDGRPVRAKRGEMIIAALLANGIIVNRITRRHREPRGLFCGIGQCTDCDPGDGYGSLTVPQVLDDYLKPLRVPAYRGAMIGHIRQQFILPVGGKVELDADAGTLRMLEPVFQA